jgi:hypothetical protein
MRVAPGCPGCASFNRGFSRMQARGLRPNRTTRMRTHPEIAQATLVEFSAASSGEEPSLAPGIVMGWVGVAGVEERFRLT